MSYYGWTCSDCDAWEERAEMTAAEGRKMVLRAVRHSVRHKHVVETARVVLRAYGVPK